MNTYPSTTPTMVNAIALKITNHAHKTARSFGQPVLRMM
jgi:hypothetical protein